MERCLSGHERCLRGPGQALDTDPITLQTILQRGYAAYARAGLRSSRGQAFCLPQLVGTGRFEINLSVPLVIEYESVLLRELSNLPMPWAVVKDVINFHCAVANRHQI